MRFAPLAAVLLLLIQVAARAGDSAAPVTITQRAPMETLSPSGDVAGVSEATIGAKMTFVSANGSQLTLQDAGGVRYVIDQSATDYTAPTAAPDSASVPATSAPSTPAATTNAMPVPENIVSASNAAPAPRPPDLPAPAPDGEVITVKIGDRSSTNDMAVWPATGLAGRPLLIAAHGNGGSGPKEITGWLGVAKDHRFTIVCPSFLSSVNCVHLSDDAPYFKDCLRWIADHLQYDKDNVYMTGFSGGGFATWYLATKYPDIFRGLFLQSGNFGGAYFGLDLSKWYRKPIKIVWGSQDLPDIPVENKQAIDMLKAEDCKNFSFEIIPGAHHQPHHDLVAAWMEQMAAPPSSAQP